MSAPHSPSPKPASAPATVTTQTYPGGADAPGYRWAFTAWVVLFLGVICLGLLNFLGQYLKQYWPGL